MSEVNYVSNGSKDFLAGIKRQDNPYCYRANANGVTGWFNGWDLAFSKACKGLNCNSVDGSEHSKECQDEHSKAYGFLPNSHNKLTEQNKLLREALGVLHSNFSRWDNLSPMDKAALNSSLKVLGETKC